MYALRDPRDQSVFYVSKGKGNRAYQHARHAGVGGGTLLDDKRGRIRQIHADGHEVIVEIVRHQLADEKAAYEVEAAVIDALTHCTHSDLKNKVRGHGRDERGWASLDRLRHLEAPNVDVPAELRPAVLIRPIRKYRYGMEVEPMWEATRGWWKMRRRDYRYAFCVHAGIVRGVWRVNGWDPASDWSSGKRRALVGEPAEDLGQPTSTAGSATCCPHRAGPGAVHRASLTISPAASGSCCTPQLATAARSSASRSPARAAERAAPRRAP